MLKILLSSKKLKALFSEPENQIALFQSLSTKQIASVFTLITFLNNPRENLSKIYVKYHEVATKEDSESLSYVLQKKLIEMRSPKNWEKLSKHIEEHEDETVYVSQTEIDRQSAETLEYYPHIERYTFNNSLYTDEQCRIIQAILSQNDESMDIQGFGGSGKTYLIQQIVNSFSTKETLITAMSVAQLNAVTQRIEGDYVHSQTITSIAHDCLSANLLERARYTGDRTKPKYRVSNQQIIREFNIQPLGNLTPSQVVNAVNSSVFNFCYRTDSKITSEHIPKYCKWLPPGDIDILVAIASRLWNETINPSTGSKLQLPLRGIHMLKHMAISRIPLPSRFKIVLADEGHDYPPVVMQIFDYSPQATLTFRDRYQAFNRNRMVKGRSECVRAKQLSCSVRSGPDAIELGNSALSHHPLQPLDMIKPTKKGHTIVEKTTSIIIPDTSCAVLTPDIWHVFYIAHNLWKDGASFTLLGDAYYALKQTLNEVIGLFTKETTMTFQKDLRGARTWDDLMRYANSHSHPLMYVNQVLDQGFRDSDMDEMLIKSVDGVRNENSYVVGRFEDAKNREFSKVYYYNPLLKGKLSSNSQLSYSVNQAYTAITRAKDKIWVPGELENWMDDTFKVT